MRSVNRGPRGLLRTLREMMAQSIDVQARLDKLTSLIAANMIAEVCSVYLLHNNGDLELYATHGLATEAVHNTILKTGEGLIGTIAADASPLNIDNAKEHPAFAYRPETSEESYNSFLGVPILRVGRTLGVLAVQNQAHKLYDEEEVEALQTTAMVLAEMLAAESLDVLSKHTAQLDLSSAMHVRGTGLCEAIGLGTVVLHEPRVQITNLLAEDTETELNRLQDALDKLRVSLDSLLDKREMAPSGEHREVIETIRMFASDRGWIKRMADAVENGLSAEAAVERVQSDTRARMMRQTDPYLRERLHDLDDLSNRLLRVLVGSSQGVEAEELPKNAILVARSMGAAELLDYDRDRIRGLILEEAASTSHVAIVARALGIAAVGQVRDATSFVDAGDAAIVDGITGDVHFRPATTVEDAYSDKVRFQARQQAQYRRLKHNPSISRDRIDIALQLNAGLLVDLPHLEETGASGIGLFRTELQFMVASSLPSNDEQLTYYSNVLKAAGPRPVTFRALDIGSDKVLPYLRSEQEENPALGWRAIRFALDRSAIMRRQIRALLRAAVGQELRLMFPMITDVAEFRRARQLVENEQRFLTARGHKVAESLKVGAMIEVPSLIFQLEDLMIEADFVSVGSNDLFQFITATDRGNSRVANRYDTLMPAFLRVLGQILEAADRHHVPVTLCGEMAGQPIDAMALIGLGFRSISMAPARIGPVKEMIRSLDVGRLRARLLPRLENGDVDVRLLLKDFALSQGVILGPDVAPLGFNEES